MRFKKKISNARKCMYQGILFDSKLERDRYIYLLQKVKDGAISKLQLQKPFELIPTQERGENKVPSISKTKNIRKTQYFSDFTYLRHRDMKWIINDVKGRTMEVYKLKLKLVILNYCSGQGWNFLETYKDKKRNNFLDL
tara:strand:+ start:3229 stop:3645 length:417 start_codon:yes stop_codon:yes gene_type:complete